MNNESNARVHWSFWLVGGVALAFNLMGCLNYIQQMNAASVAAMPDIYRTIIESRPVWGTAAFALAVFGGLFGSVLLLARKSLAAVVFAIATLGAVVAQIPNLSIPDFPLDAWIGGLLQAAITAFLIWYTKRMLTQDRSG